tara:strand:+ start:1602 stop:2609 length:1008 start_codon:yes stop_codon:yes gene_type:complete
MMDRTITTQDPIPNIRIANLYPSEASVEYKDAWGDRVVLGTCMRQAWLRYKMMESLAKTREVDFYVNRGSKDILVKPKDFSPKTMWIFKAGDKFESLVTEQMHKSGVLVAEHKRFVKPIRHGYLLSGELDAVGKDPNTGELFGVEVKSAYGYMAETNIIGNKTMRRNGQKGRPRDSNLLQAAIYDDQWPEMEYFKLVYILRDSMLRCEFDVSVHPHTGVISIDDVPIQEYTLHDVYARYATLALHIQSEEIPARDFELQYNDMRMNKQLKTGKMSKTNATAWDKYWQRKCQIEDTGKGRELKRPSLGDWQCSYCNYQDFCYDNSGNDRDLELMGG